MASERQNSLGVELRDRIVSVQLAHVTVVSRPDDRGYRYVTDWTADD